MDVWEAALFIEKKLEKIEPDGIVPLGLAQRLIKDSAYWYGHSNGPIKAPKHFERIVSGPYGWEVPFGANSFLVEKAIRRSNKKARTVLDSVSLTNQKWPSSILREELVNSVRGAVSNHCGEEYPTLWPITKGHMRFGTQSIHVDDFIFNYWQLAHLNLVTD